MLDDLVAAEELAQSYHSDRLEVLKRFLKWTYEERHLSRLPSNLGRRLEAVALLHHQPHRVTLELIGKPAPPTPTGR